MLKPALIFREYGEQERRDTTSVLSFSPVLQYPVDTLAYATLYVEAGIGVSLLDDTQFAGKDVSTHFQFEDRLGLVARFGQHKQHQLALRYFHYSNAGIKKPNPGLDFIALSYMHYF